MSPENSANERDLLRSQNRFQRVLLVGLIAVLLATVSILGFVVFRDNTIIVPPEVRRPYEVGANYANREYLADSAGYVLDKILTVTPETVDYNNKVILKMTDPDGYGTLKTSLDAAALRVKQERVATIWVPRKEDIRESEKRVTVSGKLKTYIADKLTSEHDKDYIVDFIVTTSGRLYVSKIEEVVKRDSAKPAGS